MLGKISLLIIISVMTMVLTTVFQPLSVVQTLAVSHAKQQPPDTGTCQTFSQTGFHICGRFLAYWYKYGGLRQFGYPVSNSFRETSNVDGEEHVVQYFERAVFELHPKNRPPYDILLSQLGSEKFNQKYPLGSSNPEQIMDPQPEMNVSKQLYAGISAKLIRQVQAATTGLYTGNCGLEMTWVLQVENKSNTPFVATLDTANLRMTDSTGKSYLPRSKCGQRSTPPYSGTLSGPVRLAPGETLRGTIDFQVYDIPASASYFELRVSVSGAPLEIRYMLP